MAKLRLVEQNFHEVRVDGRRVLFHAPSAALFEANRISGPIIDLLREREELEQEEIASSFDAGAPVHEALAELLSLGIVGVEAADPGLDETRAAIRDFPLSVLALNVTTGCNLNCTYCYKEDLDGPADAKRMDFETARKSVELLLSEGAKHSRLGIVFFGGEPLTNLALIRDVVDYAERRFGELGKHPDFSLTTNALLLNEEVAAYLDAHRFGITISIDGPKAAHDRNRTTVGGTGTYDMVAKNARRLLERYRSKPVGARVTLAAGAADAETIFDHLRYELGFAEVGFAPVTADQDARFGLQGDELASAFEGMKRLGRRYEDAALSGRYLGFSNLHHLIGDLYHGSRKLLPCGAGIALLAVDHEGQINLCHRFSGADVPAFGDIERGIDKPGLGAFLDRARDPSGRQCAQCHIRALCAGGCYHERYRRYGDPLHPCYHYCQLLREWIDFGIVAYSRILARNPAFFERHSRAGRDLNERGVRA
ncbi:MAG: quinohemoprotein amine dehydrogenase maturation protein [Candidatus Binataceae bacterium]|jgi:uncharacterized protein